MTVQAHEFLQPVLRVNDVSLELGGKQILRDVNLEIRNVRRPGLSQGQVVGLLGPSGIGKTRLFRIIAGLDEPDTGEVLLGEEGAPVQRGMVGVVAQNYPLFPHRTILGNLVLAGRLAGQSRQQAKERAMGFLERFSLTEHAGKYPVQLSGGQRQRVAIAQQFMCSEHYLLMDEPFSGLDLNAIDRVIDMIAEIAGADELNTFILVTHDIEAAIQISDTLWLLGRDRDDQGKIIPGARIQKVYNLIDLGLAWRKNITSDPEFIKLVQEIREIFPRL